MSGNHQRKANRTAPDSLFRRLFSTPEKVIELYNALEGTDYGPDTPVDLTTLQEVFFSDRKNDLGFGIDSHYVILAEHQSTICRNMPLRQLGYIARTLEKIVPDTEIYSAAVRKIPIPEFYVLYTGEAPWNDKVLRLSDSFDLKTEDEKIPENSMELVVKVIDLRYTEDNEILKRSSTLSGYSLLLSYVRENRKRGMSAEKAIDEAVARCIREDVLADFLKNNKEVSNMILGEGVTDEEIIAVRERDARNEGLTEGIEKGIEKGLTEGELRNNKLIEKLIDADRIEDLRRSAADEVYKKKLYEEFGL